MAIKPPQNALSEFKIEGWKLIKVREMGHGLYIFRFYCPNLLLAHHQGMGNRQRPLSGLCIVHFYSPILLILAPSSRGLAYLFLWNMHIVFYCQNLLPAAQSPGAPAYSIFRTYEDYCTTFWEVLGGRNRKSALLCTFGVAAT